MSKPQAWSFACISSFNLHLHLEWWGLFHSSHVKNWRDQGCPLFTTGLPHSCKQHLHPPPAGPCSLAVLLCGWCAQSKAGSPPHVAPTLAERAPYSCLPRTLEQSSVWYLGLSLSMKVSLAMILPAHLCLSHSQAHISPWL